MLPIGEYNLMTLACHVVMTAITIYEGLQGHSNNATKKSFERTESRHRKRYV